MIRPSPARRRLGKLTGQSRCLRFEALEDRQLLSTFTVTNATDGGPGSLRRAILDANADLARPTRINFNIAVGSIAEAATPTSSGGPSGIAAGADGALYFTEQAADKIGRIDPATGNITEINIPTANAQPVGIARGSDNNLYFTEQAAGQIGRLNPATNAITEFPVPRGRGTTPFAISSGPDGNIWFTDLSQRTIDRFDVATTAIVATLIPTAGAFAFGIASNPDGNLYFTEGLAEQIGRINARSLTIQEFAAPNTPEGITTGPDGNVWFTASATPGAAIGRLDLGTAIPTVTEFPLPGGNSVPVGITAGPDGNLWFTEFGAGRVGRITTAGAISEYSPPTANSQPSGITTGPDNLLWFTEQGSGRIGRITASPAATIRPATPLPQMTAPVTIDGDTQPGFVGVPRVVLDGGLAGANADGLALAGGASTVRGLVIDGFSRYGVIITGPGGDTIQGNLVGLAPDGVTVRGNLFGIDVVAPGATIGGTAPGAGNVISGNTTFQLELDRPGNVVQGNRIGTDAAGSAASRTAQVGIFLLNSGSNTIGGTTAAARNLISGNAGAAIGIRGPAATANLIQGNFIGTDLTGNLPVPNRGLSAVFIATDSRDNTVGGTTPGAGNTISGNAGIGVLIFDETTNNLATTGNVVRGNRIGTNAAGTARLGNRGAGVEVLGAPGNTIGGAFDGAGNTISGNGLGVDLVGVGAVGNLVQGNRIGTDVSGDFAVPNLDGVIVAGGASFNTIGGTAAAANLISGNDANGFGVLLTGTGTSDNFVLGNSIGTNAAGTAALGNGNGVGIIAGASANVVGGATTDSRNLISGNLTDGLLIDAATNNLVLNNAIGTDAAGTAALDPAATVTAGVVLNDDASGNLIGGNLISGVAGVGVVIQGQSTATGGTASHGNILAGNRIGTDATGRNPVPNGGSGVEVNAGAFLNTIGGTGPGAGNVIAFNREIGVFVDSGVGNGILGNAIFANGALGIDLAPIGVTPNTPEPHAGGPNFNQNFPVLTFATNAGANTTIAGTLDGVAGSRYRIELFANVASDPSGFGQGQTYLGFVLTTAGLNGVATFQFVAPATLAAPGRSIAATATLLTATRVDPGNDTSEFSRAVAVTGFTVFNTNDSGPGSLRQAILNVDAALSSGITIDFKIPGDAPYTIRTRSPLPTVAVPVTIDATTQTGFAGRPVVALDGLAAGPGADGLVIAAQAVTVRGLAIHGFRSDAIGNGGNGIVLQAGSGADLILGDYLGTNTTGAGGAGNSGAGVLIRNSPNNRIGGTRAEDFALISNNGGDGIEISGRSASGNVIVGDLIGTDRTGGRALGNAGVGVFIDGAPGNRIGGAAGRPSNVISGNGSAGVYVFGPAAAGNVIVGNFIGLDGRGLGPVGNGNIGVFIEQAPGNVVGGTTRTSGNVISGNRAVTPAPASGDPNRVGAGGVVILGANARGNRVLGNLIGLSAAGDRAVGNAFDGVGLSNAPANIVGGTTPGAANVISGNNVGVRISGPGATGDVIQGNRIGTDPDGTAAMGNALGGVFVENAPGNTVGGTASGAGNLVSGNRSTGVQIFGGSSRGNLILGNLIGTDRTGARPLGNAGDGIFLNSTPGNTVGGPLPSASNLIAANGRFGIELDGRGTVGNRIEGNRVGGSTGLGNAMQGIYLVGAPNNTVAGAHGPTAPNIVAGNGIQSLQVLAVRPLVQGRTVVGLTITFNRDLDPTRALIPNDYIVRPGGGSGRFGLSVGVRHLAYDRPTRTITVLFFRAIAVGRPFLLTVNAGPTFGVADTTHQLLDGAGTGAPGTNFVSIRG